MANSAMIATSAVTPAEIQAACIATPAQFGQMVTQYPCAQWVVLAKHRFAHSQQGRRGWYRLQWADDLLESAAFHLYAFHRSQFQEVHHVH